MLWISINPNVFGGYKAYFCEEDINILSCQACSSQTIDNMAGFAHQIMSLACFKQIRATFNLEDK